MIKTKIFLQVWVLKLRQCRQEMELENIEFQMVVAFVLTTKNLDLNKLGVKKSPITRSVTQTSLKCSIINMKIIYPTWYIISKLYVIWGIILANNSIWCILSIITSKI